MRNSIRAVSAISTTYTLVELSADASGDEARSVLMPGTRSEGIVWGMGQFHSELLLVDVPQPKFGTILGTAGDQMGPVRRPGEERYAVRVPF